MAMHLDITLCLLEKSPESGCRYMSYSPVPFGDLVLCLCEDL